MEEKTEQLRDIFMEVADEESVTETQSQQRGSLLATESVDDRLTDVVGRMRERFNFEAGLDDDALVVAVKRFYDGEDDKEIASALDCSPDTVFAARMDLHLLREDEPTLDPADVRDCPDDASDGAVADALEADPDQVGRARQVVAARREAQLVSHRFRTEFEEILTGADIAVQFTADTQEDGLEEATEDIETDVQF